MITRLILSMGACLIPTLIYSSAVIDDFSQLNTTQVSALYYPSNVEEIRTIIQDAKKSGKKVSVAGKLHSQGGHAFYPDNMVIDTRNFQ